MVSQLIDFLKSSYTAYQAVENAKAYLSENGFVALPETDDWNLEENGKYFIERGGSSLIAFCVGNLDEFSFKIIASHSDSPALKLKENALQRVENYEKLNAEPYGGGVWYSFFDRPLKIAGRIVKRENGALKCETVVSDYTLTIPSQAIHINREANEKFAVNAQADLAPLLSLSGGENYLSALCGGEAISYDLYLVNADAPYTFGLNGEFIASPRIDNLTSVFSSVQALCSSAQSGGISMAAIFDSEEIGSRTAQGAGGDLLETVLKRIAYSLKLDENEFYKAIASSFMISLDNAHALHPNHPEKSDPTNKTLMGGGVVIKSHANKAYATDALSAAIVKTVFTNAGVKYQTFFNRSDMRSGSTLGVIAQSRTSILCADLGLAQLAMHSANECFAKSDFEELVNGLTAF
ncbi:MAG: M18 family aminopeptidase, partial [Clostridia bacterium]|nr:M18 family aminopeptidase [Clostridia bacterium]